MSHKVLFEQLPISMTLSKVDAKINLMDLWICVEGDTSGGGVLKGKKIYSYTL